jgi:hypothetical protein
MRKFVLLAWLAVSAAGATTIQFVSLPGNTAYGTYNGFAMATVDGVSQLLVCDDYNHTTYMPSPPMVFLLSTITGPDPLEYARFVVPNDLDLSLFRYRQAAWLVDGMADTGGGGLLDLTAEYQYALWHLFTPSVRLPSQTSQTLLDRAAEAVQNGFTDPAVEERLRIYSPAPPYASNQEFLALAAPANATPEPAALSTVVIGIALILIAALARRVRRRRSAAAGAVLPG